jgi:diacylglycerol kinase (ATP)
VTKMTTYKIIVNPISGRGAGEQMVPIIENQLRSHDLEYSLTLTERPWHAADLAKQAVKEGYDVVVAAGGDGTANEVINGLMAAKNEGLGQSGLGLISVGRGNDFAYGVNVPNNIDIACQVLAKNYRSPLDVGLVYGGLYPQGRYFGNGVGIGFDAVVGFEALKMKRLHGFVSYLVAALKTIFLYYKAPNVQIAYDSQSMVINTLMISIMNGRRMGGGFMMAPRALTDDSLFDFCIASQVSRANIFRLIPRFMKGTQMGHPAIMTGQTRKLTVIAINGVLPAHADGETLCVDGTNLTMEILPRPLEILNQTSR